MDVDTWTKSIRDAHLRHAAVPDQVRGLHVPYFRRGVLSIPAFKLAAGGDPAVQGRQTSLKLMAGAAKYPADAFFFDLEDAAPDQPEFKRFARQFCSEALLSHDFGDRVVGFRPNNIRTGHFEADLVEVLPAAGHRLQFIVVPKSETADEVRDIAQLVRQACQLFGIARVPQLEVLIESPRAQVQAQAIAAVPGVAALVFGAYDFARCLGSQVHPDTWLQDQAAVRQLLVAIAASEGKDAIDAVTATLPVRPKDAQHRTPQALADRARALQLCQRDAADAARLGFAAKWILHPDQIAPIQSAWNPSRERALHALQVCAGYARAQQAGSGAELAGTQLVDKAVAGELLWVVQAGLRAEVLQDAELAQAGVTLAELVRVAGSR